MLLPVKFHSTVWRHYVIAHTKHRWRRTHADLSDDVASLKARLDDSMTSDLVAYCA